MTPLDRAAMTLALHMLRGGTRPLTAFSKASAALCLGGRGDVVDAALAAGELGGAVHMRLLRARLALCLRAALRDTSHTHFVCIRGAFGGLFQVGPMSRQRAIEMARGDSCRTVRPVRPLWTQAPEHRGER